tara:strand:+ start:198 stop:971 length:774 start_codon:yes stop_codon:yes gene_type:complete
MGISIRRERFDRVMANRKKRVIEAIQSLENISNRNNYDYHQNQIEEAYSSILTELKQVFAQFYPASPQERFQLLIKADQMQVEHLKEHDPDVYRLVMNEMNLPNYENLHKVSDDTSIPRIKDSLEELQQQFLHFQKTFKDTQKNNESVENSLWETVTKTNNASKGLEKRFNRFIEHYELENEDCIYAKNSEFSLASINKHPKFDKERERLMWIDVKEGRTLEEIVKPGSPYDTAPGFLKAQDCLLSDLKKGRVVKIG